MFPWAQYQLPHSIRPLSYDLTLNPDLNSMTFTGRTVINMSVLHNTKRIVLHGTDLNITKATFKVGFDGGRVRFHYACALTKHQKFCLYVAC